MQNFDYICVIISEDLVRYTVNMLGDHAKLISTVEEHDKFTVSDSEYMFVGKIIRYWVYLLYIHSRININHW